LNNDKDIKALYGSEGILWITVGLDARISNLYKTMGKFLNDGVFEDKYAHHNQEDQRTYLQNAFAKKKIFLILDDVWGEPCDHQEMMYWLNVALGPGSTTLITTRSKTVLSKVHAEVQVVLLLSDEDSWTLFCTHAFQNGILPPNISEDLAREVCKECKGLPLALKVIGCAMLDKTNITEWHSALLELKQSKPIFDSNVDDELYHRLQLSYYDLKHDMTKT
jgi:disease resistance protein RPS2